MDPVSSELRCILSFVVLRIYKDVTQWLRSTPPSRSVPPKSKDRNLDLVSSFCIRSSRIRFHVSSCGIDCFNIHACICAHRRITHSMLGVHGIRHTFVASSTSTPSFIVTCVSCSVLHADRLIDDPQRSWLTITQLSLFTYSNVGDSSKRPDQPCSSSALQTECPKESDDIVGEYIPPM